MPRINQANPQRRAPFVCVDCRRSFKRPIEPGVTRRPCPLCGKPAVRLSRWFKPPRAADDRAWAKVRLLIDHGFDFAPLHDEWGDEIRYPQSLREARTWIRQWADLAPGV